MRTFMNAGEVIARNSAFDFIRVMGGLAPQTPRYLRKAERRGLVLLRERLAR
jgi:hypothetical protein